MISYYELLELNEDASEDEIKRAFREKAKRLHPDIAGDSAAGEMRKLLSAYKTLSDKNRRFEYDRVYRRFTEKYYGNRGFDYRSFLREKKDDPESQVKLIFFELLHLEEEEAISIWKEQGGLDFLMEDYLDREDWMDCTYILAEELVRKDLCFEAFVLLVKLVREERRLPYFKHFMQDVETFLKELVRLRLRKTVDDETYIECLEALIELGFSSGDRARWLRSIGTARQRINKNRKPGARDLL